MSEDVTQDRHPTRLRPNRARKAAVAVAQSIVDEMTDRGYEPGTKLPTERDMVASYNVGRGTLRESLRFLELNGIVIMRAGPHGGPIVASPDGRDLAGILGLFLQLHPTTFGSLIEAREVLEPTIAKMAASKATPAALSAVQDSLDNMAANLGDEQKFIMENDRFHDAVSEAADNSLFCLLISSLHQITDGLPLGVTYPPERRRAVLRAHTDIYEAIKAGDPDRAEAAMARHMSEFKRYVQKAYPSIFSRRLRWSEIAP